MKLHLVTSRKAERDIHTHTGHTFSENQFLIMFSILDPGNAAAGSSFDYFDWRKNRGKSCLASSQQVVATTCCDFAMDQRTSTLYEALYVCTYQFMQQWYEELTVAVQLIAEGGRNQVKETHTH